MDNFLLLIIGLIIGVEVGYYFYYSPRAEIKRLLRQMYKIPIKCAKARISSKDNENFYYNTAKTALTKRNKIINDLLSVDYYFDPEKDKKYIEEKKSTAQFLLDNVEKIFE